jgi:hypothetical protein
MVERIRFADARRLAMSPVPEPPMLITESKEEFNRIRAALNEEIRPRGILEELYVADIANHTWTIVRANRLKVALINSEFLAALAFQIFCLARAPYNWEEGNPTYSVGPWAEVRAKKWFTDEAEKKKIVELLGKYGLDESAIEAQAFRRCAFELAALDRMAASAELRRSKALRNIAECDAILAQRLSANSDQIVKGKTLAIAGNGVEAPATAA